RYADALQTADNIMTFRTVIKEVALSLGLYATFMPKPFTEHPGSGMHTHFSLFEGDTNAFFEAGSEFRLSRTARHFIAGILRHAPEFTSVTNQFVNSYKRLWGGGEAPSYLSWGHNNRSALVRVPLSKPDKVQAARIEYRGIDSATNPYLSYAALLAAGLKGIENEYDLPPVELDDVAAMSSAERRALGHNPLPSSLYDAIRETEESEFMAELLGEQVYDYFLRNKRRDWNDYRRVVTPFELKNNLGVL
ncbi:MAG: glutamine synthetase family protein, partial [Actinomycetota bacterium]